MICAVADGVYSSYEEAAEQFIGITRKYCMREKLHDVYSVKYEKYKIIRETMKKLYAQI